jgi:hypothetical protein
MLIDAMRGRSAARAAVCRSKQPMIIVIAPSARRNLSRFGPDNGMKR